MSYYENGPDIEERDLPIHITGPWWFVTYHDVNAESAADVVVACLATTKHTNFVHRPAKLRNETMKQLHDEGHEMFVRHGYAWKIDGEDYPGLGYFALSEDDAISDADTLFNERKFYAMADMIEDQMDEERWARGK